ncbi:MAG: DUF4382 domain-containing protein [Chloroflexota bacterium]
MSIQTKILSLALSLLLLVLVSCRSNSPNEDSSSTSESSQESVQGGSDIADSGMADNDAASSDQEGANQVANTGTLTFVANGEDFVRQGFVSKDGWSITFERLTITLENLSAYQTDPPYDASDGERPTGTAISRGGPFTVDLAADVEDAQPISIDVVDESPSGQYNAISWRMALAQEGDTTGSSIHMVGIASQGDMQIHFALAIDEEYSYHCGEYIGDERKGFLPDGGDAELEATFHFDHLFGNGDAPSDDAINQTALGFEPLAALAEDGQVETTLSGLAEQLDENEFTLLTDALASLGHVGEGHCFEAEAGYTGQKDE